jgi:type I restriction enzyme S subunit
MAKTYDSYKDSGIAWIGEIPSGWGVCRIKDEYVFQTGATPPTGNEAYFDGDNVWVSIADMKGKIVNDSKKKLSYNGIQKCSMSIVPKGSLLYSFKLSVGNVAFAGKDLYTNEAIASFLPLKGYLPFLYYIAPQFIVHNANTNIYGAKILNQELIKNAPIPLPPLSEQHTIVSYLDEKCGDIDALISLQEEMISELQAYKQSVITEAVTKGLDPNAKMKDSGVEWIGEIPEGWKVVKLKHLCYKIGDGLHGTPIFDEQGFAYFINGNNLGQHFITIKEDTNKVDKTEYDKFKIDLSESTILISLNGTIGNCSFYNNEPIVLSKSAGYISLKSDISKEYMRYLLLSNGVKIMFELSLAGTTIANLSLSTMRNLPVLLPPLEAQRSIATYLDVKCGDIDLLISLKQEKIETLKDYKKSIIYEYVTGKKRV